MNTALLLSGGSGSRMKLDLPKQYISVDGRMIISYALEALMKHELIDAVQIVASGEYRDIISKEIKAFDAKTLEKFRGFSDPGATRQLSIYNGIKDISGYASDDDVVLIHDAARPLVSADQIKACISGCVSNDGAMPVLPMKDTVYLSRDGRMVSELLDRKQIFAGQAPEAFILGKYLEANERLMPDKIKAINGSTEPAVLAGMDVAMIPGDEGNFKITTMADLERFKEIISGRDD